MNHNRRTSQRGASLVEYALLVVLIALVCITVVTELGTTIRCKLQIASIGLVDDTTRWDIVYRMEIINVMGVQYYCRNPTNELL